MATFFIATLNDKIFDSTFFVQRGLFMTSHNNINYIEIPVKDLANTKQFFTAVFNWEFVDYGPDYSSFSQGINGGFFTADTLVNCTSGSPLIVLYSKQLEQTEKDIKQNGGTITKAIFSFPGGRRFHFNDINNNEYAVWSE